MQTMPSQQSLLGRSSVVDQAVEKLANSGIEERGAIYTKQEVVQLMLRMMNYQPDLLLENFRILEPCFGEGGFLFSIVKNLLESIKLHHHEDDIFKRIGNSIRAVELHRETFLKTKDRLRTILKDAGISKVDSEMLVNTWLVQDDFLLHDFEEKFTHIIGNPPYVRQESIPVVLKREYKERFETMYDRADLYILFFEKSLNLLKSDGKMSFICSDRWTKNKYGAPLREMISKGFHLSHYIDMTDFEAFETEVDAYPSIVVIHNGRNDHPTKVVRFSEASDANGIASLVRSLHHDSVHAECRTEKVLNGFHPWTNQGDDTSRFLARLQADFSSIESANCKVGIGVATGCDDVYIRQSKDLNIEEDRKLPLIMRSDTHNGKIGWSGRVLVNPFDSNGSLVDLESYPLLRQYFAENDQRLLARHVARKNPKSWYRTIDKVDSQLLKTDKLLIPDISDKPLAFLDDGKYYPHHNFYYVTSGSWDLQALRCVLTSAFTKFIISMYSTKVRGGYLRFQAQHLRRIPLPNWDDVPVLLQKSLIESSENSDGVLADEAIHQLYNLSLQEQEILSKYK